jgi:long-subunit fatty acid transport protein
VKNLLIAFVLLIDSTAALAAEAVYFGFSNTTYSSPSSNTTYKDTLGFEAGYSVLFSSDSRIQFRTGLGLAQRDASWEVGSLNRWELDLIMLEAPITLLYDLNKSLSGFAGLKGNFIAFKSCKYNGASTCSDIEELVKTFLFSFVAGVNHSIGGKHAVEAYFEASMDDVAIELKYNVLGVRYVYALD